MGATGYLNHHLGSSVEVGWKKERQEDLALCLGSFPPFLRPFALSAKEDQTPRNQVMKGSGPAADDGLMKDREPLEEESDSRAQVAVPALKGLHSKPRGDVCAPQSPCFASASDAVRTQEAQALRGDTMNVAGSTCEVSAAVPAGVRLSGPHINPAGHLDAAGVPTSQTPAVHSVPAHRRDEFARDEQVPVRNEQAPAAISELSQAGVASTCLDARDGSTSVPGPERTHGMEASAGTEENVKPTLADKPPSPRLGCGGGGLADETVLDESWTTEGADLAPQNASQGEAATSTSAGTVAQALPAAASVNSDIAAGSDSQVTAASQPLSDDCVWGSTLSTSVESPATEHLLAPSSVGRKRRLEEASTDPPPWGDPIEPDSPGDTADIAIAAVSYANSVAERGAVGIPSGSTTTGSTRPASNHTCEGPSIADAVPKNGTANDLMVASESSREEEGASTGPAVGASTQPDSRTSSNSKAAPHGAELSSVAVAIPGPTRTSSRGKTGLRGSDHHDDMMQAMCMICLEKLSDATEGGGAKMLGLLDSCSHRYCYTCILEWSKITNKCPQCKARFHTIKAIKELRRNNHRYRGVQVRVEDKDQVYSFVDVRDVVVLDPDVTCHAGCLVRRGVDAFERGWEFSVQCENCSKWYHGLCVGFSQEREVPDQWFCRPCRGESYQAMSNPDAITEPAAEGARQGTTAGAESGGRRQTGGRLAEGHDVVHPSVSGQGRLSEAARNGCEVREQDSSSSGVSRAASDRQRRGNGEGTLLAEVAGPQRAPQCPAPPAQLENVESPSPRPPSAVEASGQVSGAPNELTQWPTLPSPERVLSLFDPQQHAPMSVTPGSSLPLPTNADPPLPPPVAVSSAPRGRGRPRGSRNKSASPRSPHVQPPASPQPVPVSPIVPVPSAGVQSTQSPPRTGAAGSARGRGRPRGSKNSKPPPDPPASEAQPGSQSAPPTSEDPAARPSQGEEQQQQRESAHPLVENSVKADGVRLSDAITRPPEPPAPSFIQSLEALEVNDLCHICGFDTEPDNLIVYCSSCDMGVHQTCYGISEIPSKEWYCSPCSAGVHPSTLACRFCPIKGGALKRCSDGSWGHILCAFWIPECCFLDPQKMEPIGSISRKGQAGGVEKHLPAFRSRKCYVCGTNAGSAIRCHTSSCKFHLHPMCGSKAGSVYMEIETTVKKSADGAEHESVNLVARCPRHNKNKVKEGPRFKNRGTIIGSTADPLSVVDKVLEIDDPKGGVALTGKVTWFNPETSKYCIVASRDSGDGDVGGGSGSGSGCSGSGDPKEVGSHWISVDNLVEAKAIGVQKNGKKFLLQTLPSVEEAEAGIRTESGYQQKCVKIEQREAEEESDVPSRDQRGESTKESPRREKGAAADFGCTEQGERGKKEGGITATGKRRRNTPAPPASDPDVAPTKRLARSEVQPRQAKALELDSQPLQPEPGEAGDAVPLLGHRDESSQPCAAEGAASETENRETSSSHGIEPSTGMGHPIQQPARFLPSVHFPQQEADGLTRYPIRGRLKRPTNTIVDPNEKRAPEGMPSTKRVRQDVEAHQENVASGHDGMKLACVKEAVAGSSRVGQTPQERHSSAKGEVPRQSGSAFDLKPGWSHGTGLGLVPVMRARGVRVPGGGDATYFASAYVSTSQNVVCDKRSSPRFSFDFGELETRIPGGATKQQRSDNMEGVCEPSERAEGKDHAEKHAGNEEAERAEVSVAPFAREPGDEEDQSANGEGRETIDKTKFATADGVDVEDEEASAYPDGGADVMPPSPRSTDRIDGDAKRASGREDQGGEDGQGVGGQDEQNVSKDASNLSGVKGECNDSTEANGMEDVEISSDGGSCGGFEGAEAASSCISEDEDDDDFGRGWGLCLDRHDGGEAPEISRVGVQSHCSTAGYASSSAVAGLSSDAMKITQDLPGRLAAQNGAVEGPESPPDVDAMRSSDPEDRKSTDLKVTKEGFHASGGASNAELVEGDSAVEAEPEIAVAEPPVPQQTGMTLALRSIVREQFQGVLRSASKGEKAALAGSDGRDVLERIAADTECELFQRLYQDSTGGREYKAKYKQLLLSLGNVRNYRLVASVLSGNTTPVDLATKDAVGLLNSLSSSLNVLAIPLSSRQRQGSSAGSPGGKSHNHKGKRRGRMQLL